MGDEAWHDIAGSPDDPNALAGRRVLVMGLGLLGGGVAAARYAVEHGAASVTVTDLRSPEVLAPSIQRLAGLPIRYVLGRHEETDFAQADVVVRNPGVRRTSPLLQIAREHGARIEMEIAWFFRACQGRIAGVTGTRGKSTTTMLLHHIMTAAGVQPLLGGNLGGIETLSLLPQITPNRWVVLELGNWMLEGLHPVRRSPHLAIFTNLLPDHLDAYDSMDDYGEAKSSIFRYQLASDIALFNADNSYTRRYGAMAPASNVWFWSQERMLAYPRGHESSATPFIYGDAIRLRGAHNIGNVQAATLAAELIGIESDTIRRAVSSFPGVPHRLEVVRVLDGVTFINDSASTAPVAGVAALRSFTEPVVLIAGGNSKNLDFSSFAHEAATRAKRVILLKGNATVAFREAIRDAARAARRPDPTTEIFDDLQAALDQARRDSAAGDVVLLSPGFTSFGMFLNEFDRGTRFRALVQAIPERSDQPRSE